jgi:hypothetical protein
MRIHFQLVASLALALPAFASSSGEIVTQDTGTPDPMTLREGVYTVLYHGVDQSSDVVTNSSTTEGGGSAFNYCQATPNSFGFTGAISFTGSLELADGSFGLRAVGNPLISQSWGMFTYGLVQTNIPFGNGYLCISPFAPGINKMPTQQLGSIGEVNLAMNANPSLFSAFTPGSGWNFQFWYRDPSVGAHFNLSDALHVDFAP